MDSQIDSQWNDIKIEATVVESLDNEVFLNNISAWHGRFPSFKRCLINIFRRSLLDMSTMSLLDSSTDKAQFPKRYGVSCKSIFNGCPYAIKRIDTSHFIQSLKSIEALFSLLQSESLLLKGCPYLHSYLGVVSPFDEDVDEKNALQSLPRSLFMVSMLSPCGNLEDLIFSALETRRNAQAAMNDGQQSNLPSLNSVTALDPFKMSLSAKYSILLDISLGIQHLHGHSLVHGRLAPGNVLLFPGNRAKLSDFCIQPFLKMTSVDLLVHSCDHSVVSDMLTDLRCSLRWMPPEQVQRRERLRLLYLRAHSTNSLSMTPTSSDSKSNEVNESSDTSFLLNNLSSAEKEFLEASLYENQPEFSFFSFLEPSGDIYGIGVLAFTLLTWQLPYHNLPWEDSVRSFLIQSRGMLSLPSKFPESQLLDSEQLNLLEEFFKKCVDMNPGYRANIGVISTLMTTMYTNLEKSRKKLAYEQRKNRIEEIEKEISELKTKTKSLEDIINHGKSVIDKREAGLTAIPNARERREAELAIEQAKAKRQEYVQDRDNLLLDLQCANEDLMELKKRQDTLEEELLLTSEEILKIRPWSEDVDVNEWIGKYFGTPDEKARIEALLDPKNFPTSYQGLSRKKMSTMVVKYSLFPKTNEIFSGYPLCQKYKARQAIEQLELEAKRAHEARERARAEAKAKADEIDSDDDQEQECDETETDAQDNKVNHDEDDDDDEDEDDNNTNHCKENKSEYLDDKNGVEDSDDDDNNNDDQYCSDPIKETKFSTTSNPNVLVDHRISDNSNHVVLDDPLVHHHMAVVESDSDNDNDDDECAYQTPVVSQISVINSILGSKGNRDSDDEYSSEEVEEPAPIQEDIYDPYADSDDERESDMARLQNFLDTSSTSIPQKRVLQSATQEPDEDVSNPIHENASLPMKKILNDVKSSPSSAPMISSSSSSSSVHDNVHHNDNNNSNNHSSNESNETHRRMSTRGSFVEVLGSRQSISKRRESLSLLVRRSLSPSSAQFLQGNPLLNHQSNSSTSSSNRSVSQYIMEKGLMDHQLSLLNLEYLAASLGCWDEAIGMITVGQTIDQDIVQELIRADISPLHVASMTGQLKIIHDLMEFASYLHDFVDIRHRTPLHKACQEGHCNVVKYLIEERQADPYAMDKDGMNALHFCIIEGHMEIVQFLMENLEKVPKMPSTLCDGRFQASLLHWASVSNQKKVVEYLVQRHGMAIDIKVPSDNTTPLFWATFGGSLDIVKYFLDKGARVDVKDNAQNTLLHVAAASGSYRKIRFFLEDKKLYRKLESKGISISCKNIHDCIPYALATGAVKDYLDYRKQKGFLTGSMMDKIASPDD